MNEQAPNIVTPQNGSVEKTSTSSRKPSKNPGGRPKGTPNQSTQSVKAFFQRFIDFEEIGRALEIKAKAGDVAAARLLIEYGWGKAPQPIEHSGEILMTKVEVQIIQPTKTRPIGQFLEDSKN